jgi:hypothetical protein
MFGLNGISTLDVPHSAIAKSVQRIELKVTVARARSPCGGDGCGNGEIAAVGDPNRTAICFACWSFRSK